MNRPQLLRPFGSPLVSPLVRGLVPRGAGAYFYAALGIIPPWLTFSRASGAAAFTGGVLTEYAANVPRFTATGLIIEGSRTNQSINPRLEGGVSGTPGTFPISGGYAFVQPVSLAFSTVNNIPRMDMVYAPAASGSSNIRFATGTVSVVSGTLYASSFYTGFLAPPPVEMSGLWLVSPGTPDLFINPASVPSNGGMSRIGASYASSTTATGNHILRSSFSGACAFTLRAALPQFESGAFASTPILPAVGAPAAATRARESLTSLLSTLGLPASARGTYLFSGQIPDLGADMALFDLHDGTMNNRLSLIVTAAGATQAKRVLGGSVAASSNSGGVSAATNFRIGLALAGDGTARVYVAGGTEQVVSGGPTGGLTTLSLSGAVSGDEPFNRIWAVRVLPAVLAPSDLQAAVNALPVAM